MALLQLKASRKYSSLCGLSKTELAAEIDIVLFCSYAMIYDHLLCLYFLHQSHLASIADATLKRIRCHDTRDTSALLAWFLVQ